MTEREAIEIVCAAAALAANGHERSEEIHAAIVILKQARRLASPTERWLQDEAHWDL